jgi:hypothetical protein
MNKIIYCFVFLFISGTINSLEKESLLINKSQFIAASVYVGMRMGENWAVDIAQKSITKTVSSNNPFFEWTVGSAIRGQTLLTALPIAAKLGAQNGAIVAAVIAPIIWDCSVSICKSCKKTLSPLLDDPISIQEKPTTWDKRYQASKRVKIAHKEIKMACNTLLCKCQPGSGAFENSRGPL